MDALRSAVLKARFNHGTDIIATNKSVDGRPLDKQLEPQEKAKPTEPFFVQKLLAEIARAYELTPEGMKSQRRFQTYFLARAEFCYRAFMETTLTMPAIGRALGNRDHTSVRNAIAQHCTLHKLPFPPGVNWDGWRAHRAARMK